MTQRQRSIVSIIAAGVMLALLIGLTAADPPGAEALLPGALFLVLVVFTHTFGVPLAGGRASLLPTATVAAFLVMGLAPAGWVVFLGGLLHGAVRYRWAEELQQQPLRPLAALGVASANAAVQAASIVAAGAVYYWRGGITPFAGADWQEGVHLVPLAFTYLVANLLLAGLYLAMQGRRVLRRYLRSLHKVFLFEGWPLIFAPFMALTYIRLGLFQFALMGLGIVVVSLTMRNLSLARQRLERRVSELDSLQAVGQALSASLDLDAILTAIHAEVGQLMPARNFYVALYDPETDEVSFPLAIEAGERVNWRSRRAGNGLTEHVLRTRAPLLVDKEYEAVLETLGLDQIGQPPACWLGVPIVAGLEALGVIAVQSYSDRQAYDASHQEVLVTIAAQAAVAIQNARLYARTDEALARRVQELGSILQTTREGILLLDLEHRVLAANRALADFVGVAQLELQERVADAPGPSGEPAILSLVGYTEAGFEADCRALAGKGTGLERDETVVSGPPERHVERTLAPVRGRDGGITGWLLVLRDLTEERELARLREDMIHMLVHDLRSPLAVLVSGLELMELELADGNLEALEGVLKLARQSSDHMLGLVNDLLDVSRLESGQVSVQAEALEVKALLEKVADRLAPMAEAAQIEVEVEVEGPLRLDADPNLMDRVLHNLVDNALKFTPDGGRVRLWAYRESRQGEDALLIGVTDTGPGIPPEMHERIFQKFQQLGKGKGRRRGTGLGLPFCKLAIEAHGGRIWVESQVGEGSTFVLRLPVTQAR